MKKILLLFILIFLIGCVQPEQADSVIGGDNGNDSKPTSPITNTLSLNKTPYLNEDVELSLTMNSSVPVENVSAQIEIPEGFELVEGNSEWTGNLNANEDITYTITVKAVELGEWTFFGKATGFYDNNIGTYSVDGIYISISQDETIVSETPFQHPSVPVKYGKKLPDE